MKQTQAYLEVGSHRLLIRRFGNGHPLLLLHGHSLDGRMWGPQLETLGPHFNLIIPDLLGYGGSSKPNLPFNHAEILLQMLAQLEVEQAHVMGLSLGGNIALELALYYPERVNRLILADSSLKGFPQEPEYAASLASIQRVALEQGVQAARKRWIEHPLFASLASNPKLRDQLAAWVADYDGWHWLEGISPSGGIREVSTQLAEIQSETLVLVGALDLPRNRLIAQTLASTIPKARLEVLPEVGHLPNLEATARFNQLCLEFFSDRPI